MSRLPRRLLPLLALAALLWAPARLPAAPAEADKKPAANTDLPAGARAVLGSGRFRHTGQVTWVYALPDGKHLLTLATDQKVRVWDLASGKKDFEIVPYAAGQQFGYGTSAAVSPDHKVLATATADRIVRLWDLATGKEQQQFAPLPANQTFTHIAWSPDGKSLVTQHADRVSRIWEVATGKELRTLGEPNPYGGYANVVRFTPDGKSLAAIEDWSVKLLDAEDGKELRWLGGHTTPIVSMDFTPDHKRLVTVASDRTVRVWDLATGKTVAKLPLPLGGGRGVEFTPDGKTVVIGCNDHTLRLFDLATAKETGKIDVNAAYFPTSFAISKDGKALYLSCNEPVVRTYDLASGKELFPVTGHLGAVTGLAWSPDGKTIATAGSGDRTIILWDANGKLVRQLPALEQYNTTQMQFAPGGKKLLSYGFDRTVRTWDLAEGKELGSFMVSPVAANSFAFSGDGKLAAVTGFDRKVRVWDVAGEKQLHVLEVKQAPAAGPGGRPIYYGGLFLTFAGDNRTLLGSSPNERLVRRWDAVTGKEAGEIKGVSMPAGTMWAPAPDGRCFPTTSPQNYLTTNVVEASTGKVRAACTLPQPAPPAPGAPRVFVQTNGATISPDGRTLATTTTDGALHFWDVGSGKELVARKLGFNFLNSMAFAPDSKTLAVAGNNDASVVLWDVPGPAAEGRLVIKDVTADQFDDLWRDLGGDDTGRGYLAVQSLASLPGDAVPYLQKKLKPTAAPDAKQIDRWIAELDADEFETREKAATALSNAGKAVEAAVRKALDNKPSAEAKTRLEDVLGKVSGERGLSQDELRGDRAVEALERIGTPEAQKVLEEIAKGGDSRLTVEARAAAGRLKARVAAP